MPLLDRLQYFNEQSQIGGYNKVMSKMLYYNRLVQSVKKNI